MARKALGRGLRALIPESEPVATDEAVGRQRVSTGDPLLASVESPPASEDAIATASQERWEKLRYVPVDAVIPNPRQPRSGWDHSQLEELAGSIATKGLLEPIIVRPQGARYEIVAGERRWRACMMAGLSEIPAIVRSYEDQDSLEAALIENLQRNDLNPVDEARAYQNLMSEFGLTHEEVAKRVSKDRSTVTNLLRILRLPEQVLAHVSRGTLSLGHARVIVGTPEDVQLALAERIVEDGWSVRQAEEWAARVARRRRRSLKPKSVTPGMRDVHLREVQDALVRHLGAEVRIRRGRKGGQVEIQFTSDEDLSRILDLIGIVIA